jgi:hypothetical protein
MSYKGRTDNYPDDIRQYDNDPRSPFYDSRFDDYVEDELQERLPTITADRMEECYYGEDCMEDIDWEDEGFKQFMEVLARIKLEAPISQEDINKSFMYFAGLAIDWYDRAIDNDIENIRETLEQSLKDEAECARYGI